jgi:hypothetical protein
VRLARNTERVLASAPLTTLISWAWIAHTIEIDNEVERWGHEHFRRRYFRISLPMWTNGLRHIDEGGITLDELRARAHATCNVGGLERWGWVTVGEPVAGKRSGFGTHTGLRGSTVLRPTRAGEAARRVWPRTVDLVEERWRARFGDDLVAALADALGRYAAPMPWSPPEVHPSDGFLTHVVAGSDDPAVPQPLVARLGRVLTGFTIDHERATQTSLPLAANFLRIVDSGAARIRDLPSSSGISKEAVAMALGFACREGWAARGADRSVRLTDAGVRALAEYWEVGRSHEDAALEDALRGVLASPALAEGLVPPPGNWRGEPPYLAQTRRVLADPVRSLPWHPMVLHRGGWPDGS